MSLWHAIISAVAVSQSFPATQPCAVLFLGPAERQLAAVLKAESWTKETLSHVTGLEHVRSDGLDLFVDSLIWDSPGLTQSTRAIEALQRLDLSERFQLSELPEECQEIILAKLNKMAKLPGGQAAFDAKSGVDVVWQATLDVDVDGRKESLIFEVRPSKQPSSKVPVRQLPPNQSSKVVSRSSWEIRFNVPLPERRAWQLRREIDSLVDRRRKSQEQELEARVEELNRKFFSGMASYKAEDFLGSFSKLPSAIKEKLINDYGRQFGPGSELARATVLGAKITPVIRFPIGGSSSAIGFSPKTLCDSG